MAGDLFPLAPNQEMAIAAMAVKPDGTIGNIIGSWVEMSKNQTG
uniref:Uncharacterized protein n=1 Tax=Cyanothece sp. (strain PCC 7425 / ATCC 29141) TaxID=395961 RepID=B8HMP3_CYAP4